VREVDAGLETLEVDLPAVISTDLRLNEPRFIKLPDIMKAKSKPLETLELGRLGVESGDHLSTVHYAPPPKRSKGVMVKDVPSWSGHSRRRDCCKAVTPSPA
jgi:electron transfer flavoprotein beta subunit